MTFPTPKGTADHLSDRDVLKAVLHEDFMSFVQYGFGVVRPGAVFKPNWHLEAIAHKLAQVERGEVKRLIITVPPRNLKSICASVALPAWALGRKPTERVVCVSYSDQLAKTHANDFRRLVKDPLYQAVFPRMRLDPRKDTEREIMTTERGKRLATSIEGTLTGLGGNLFIIDDPLKPGDAMSESVRQKVIDWYRNTLITRGDDKANTRIIVVMQRVHAEDLVGYLLEQGGYELLNLPAIAEEPATFDLGYGRTHRRKRMDALHLAHEPGWVLDEIKREMGTIAFSAQYQQAPVPPGGVIIKREWIKEKPLSGWGPNDRYLISWDIALSEAEKGDYSAGIVAVRRGETFQILEVHRGRWPFDQLKRKIIEVKRRYTPSTLIIEDSPISKGLIQAVREQCVSVVEVRPDSDKRARLIAQSDLFESGAITLAPNAPWIPELMKELLAFPGGRHDDQVDALSQLLKKAREDWSLKAYSGVIRGSG